MIKLTGSVINADLWNLHFAAHSNTFCQIVRACFTLVAFIQAAFLSCSELDGVADLIKRMWRQGRRGKVFEDWTTPPPPDKWNTCLDGFPPHNHALHHRLTHSNTYLALPLRKAAFCGWWRRKWALHDRLGPFLQFCGMHRQTMTKPSRPWMGFVKAWTGLLSCPKTQDLVRLRKEFGGRAFADWAGWEKVKVIHQKGNFQLGQTLA